MWNYETIKDLAFEQGQRINNLLALAPKNDPFYTGRPAEKKAAEWFAGLWQQFGYARGVHLRRIHYQLVSQDPPEIMPIGKPYQNTESCWDYLNEASKWARYLSLVAPSAFVDKRNPEARIFYEKSEYDNPNPRYRVSDGDGPDYDGYDLPDLPELPELPDELPGLPDFEVTGYYGVQQPYLVEIWAEKTTVNDILIPLCQSYKVNLVTGAGELSITAVIDFLKRVQQAGRAARILYISDFDPAGLGMPISVARKVEFYQRNEGLDKLDIRLEPVILTETQAEAYNLPRIPIKDTNTRKAGWEAQRGQGATELDALEALRPGELRRIVEAAILNYYDPTLTRRAGSQRARLEAHLDDLRDNIIESHEDDIAGIEAEYQELLEDWERTRQRFAEMVADFQPRIDAYAERLETIKERYRWASGVLYSDLNAIELDDDDQEKYKLPEPDLPEENDDLLYDSSRDYLDQLAYYQAYRGNGTQEGPADEN